MTEDIKKIEVVESVVEQSAETPSAEPKKKRSRLPTVLLILLVLTVVSGGIGFLLIGLPVLAIKAKIPSFQQNITTISQQIQSRNLKEAVIQLKKTETIFKEIESDYRRMAFLGPIPWLGNFYKDGKRIFSAGGYLFEVGDLALKAVEPYADLLGLEQKPDAAGKTPKELTTEGRLILALDTLDKVQPELDKIGKKLDAAKKEVDEIKDERYPDELFGRKVRENVTSVKKAIDGAADMAGEIKPIISYLKPMLGVPDEKKYLLLFQNDAELRPTGGFLTAYAVLSVKGGKLTPLGSYDIYDLDARFGNRLKAPQPILDFHKNVFNWHLRDMNLSPDFKVSMITFLENYERVVGKGTVDAILSVDTKMLVDLLKILGPVGVGGVGTFSAENDKRCDCPQVVYELEKIADKPVSGFRTGRKAILGPLMHSILLNMMQSPGKKWPEYFEIIFRNIQEKHLLFYFFDEKLQATVESLNAGGRIKEFDGDYLHVNDCNFAGAKSNMFIKESFQQTIEVDGDGTVTKTLVVDYKNPAPPSNCNLEAGQLCLNGLYRDWVRIYVPKGSELIEANGSEIQVRTYEDLGKTVFEAFYGDKSPLRPQGTAKLTFKYKLPFKVKSGSPYKLLIQKQPGTYGYENIIKVNGRETIFDLLTDQELSL